MKPILFSLFYLMASNIYGQEVEMQLSQLPVKNGLIYKDPGHITGLVIKQEGVFVRANNDSCFATEDGLITSTFNLGSSGYAIIIMPTDDRYVTYSNLVEIAVKRGEKIKRGMFIGLLKEKNKQYQLLYMLSNNSGNVLPHEKHLEYLKSNAGMPGL